MHKTFGGLASVNHLGLGYMEYPHWRVDITTVAICILASFWNTVGMAVTQTHGVLVPFVNFLATAELLVAIARRKVISAGNRCARKNACTSGRR